MNKNNDFLKTYLSLPQFNDIRKYILTFMLTINLFVPGMMLSYRDAQCLSSIPNKNLMITVLIIFNLLSLILLIFVKKLAFLFYLYSATIFSIFSVFCLCLAMKIINANLEITLALIANTLSILIYIFLLLILKKNISIKLKFGNSRNVSNKKFTKVCVSLGVLFSIVLKKYLTGNMSVAFIDLLSSYCFSVSYVGFHKFYFRFKYYKKI